MEAATRSERSDETGPRLVEVVAALSLATDLGLGQAMEHGLRSCLIATRLAEWLDLEQATRDQIYWVSLLATVGCTADSYELRRLFGDDIALRAGIYDVGPSELAIARYFLARAGSDGGPLRRVRSGATLMATGMRAVVESLVSHCQVTGLLAERLGLVPGVRDPPAHTFARWDGKGVPRGLAGEEIAIAARMLVIADAVEVEHRLRGLDAGLTLARHHAGSIMDPALVEALAGAAGEILEDLDDLSWEAVVAAEPARAAAGRGSRRGARGARRLRRPEVPLVHRALASRRGPRRRRGGAPGPAARRGRAPAPRWARPRAWPRRCPKHDLGQARTAHALRARAHAAPRLLHRPHPPTREPR